LREAKMWDKEAALDLRAKTEDYLLEHRPQGYRSNDRALVDGRRLRLAVDRAYYERDAARHKKAVDEMMLSTLENYAFWLWVHRGEASAGSRTTR
jgi:hypothetical protein